MFSKLKNALSKLFQSLSTTKQLDKSLDSLFFDLIECDVAYDVAESIINEVKMNIEQSKSKSRNVKDLVYTTLKELIMKIYRESNPFNFIEYVKSINEKPVKVVFFGVNGVGKTTTIAKIANLLKQNNISSLLVAADTFRAGAQEQLEKHAIALNIPIYKAKYGADPAAIAYDAILYAKRNNFDVVLIDTAGRMHTDVDLIEEMKKICRIVRPHLRIMVIDSLTGNDAIEQAKIFNEEVGIDGIIVTKVDADDKGGTILSVMYSTKKPILYIGTGSKYSDIREFDINWYIKLIIPPHVINTSD